MVDPGGGVSGGDDGKFPVEPLYGAGGGRWSLRP